MRRVAFLRGILQYNVGEEAGLEDATAAWLVERKQARYVDGAAVAPVTGAVPAPRESARRRHRSA